jgi:uroporphyrinogen decarboxylase
VSCAGMDPAALKRDFGAQLTFWGGGCDTRFILRQATPDEIRRHVQHQIEILKPSGGFVFQQVHNVLADVPPENVVAMLDAAHDAGR